MEATTDGGPGGREGGRREGHKDEGGRRHVGAGEVVKTPLKGRHRGRTEEFQSLTVLGKGPGVPYRVPFRVPSPR